MDTDEAYLRKQIMLIELSQDESNILINAIRMYKSHLQQCNEDIAKLEKINKEEPKDCPYHKDIVYIVRLRDRLKQFQMQFPLEEHWSDCQYSYGKVFGYEKANWK